MFLYHEMNELAKLTIFHHFVFITGVSSAIIAGYSMPGSMNLALFSEISSIFLNIKGLFPEK